LKFVTSPLVIDASVLVAAVSPPEPGHEEALLLFRRIHEGRIAVMLPRQFFLEVYAAFSRNPRQVKALGFMTVDKPIKIQFCPLGEAEVQNCWSGSLRSVR
jgi:predicted nucleic acid-binding protein